MPTPSPIKKTFKRALIVVCYVALVPIDLALVKLGGKTWEEVRSSTKTAATKAWKNNA